MIKAGSLFYAIVISLIIAIVSSSLILFAYLTRIEFESSETSERIQLNADSGLNLLMANQELIGLNGQKTMDLFGTGEDSVQLSRKSWGAYEVIISKAVFKNNTALRIAQAGYFPDSTNSYSLYLEDEDKPLSLCGKTLIRGTAWLPAAGAKRAYIEGQNFIGEKLIDGTVKKSEKSLPEFNKALTDNIQSILSKKIITENDSVIFIENELSGDSLINSFNKKTLVLSSAGAIKIASGVYVGNIAIISGKQITVSADAVLKDVIIAAPKIIFEKEFKGTVQAFAYDSIIANENVRLSYPSVLAIVQNERSLIVSAVVLNKNDTLLGAAFAFRDMQYPLKQTGVIIRENAMVTGQVYSNGYVDLKGSIFGSLMCSKILLSTSSSVYENHLLNAVIDVTKLPPYFVGINLVKESLNKKIAKWLN